MSLTARLVAIQGIGFSPIQLAVQGLLETYSGKHLHQDTDQGVAPKAQQRDYLSENLIKIAKANYNLTRLQQDDQLAAEFIMALVQMEFLDGY